MSKWQEMDPLLRKEQEGYVERQVELLFQYVDSPDLVAWVATETIAANIALDAMLRGIEVRAHLERFFNTVLTRTLALTDKVDPRELREAVADQKAFMEKRATESRGVGDN